VNHLDIIDHRAVRPVNQTSFCEDGPRFSNESPCSRTITLFTTCKRT